MDRDKQKFNRDSITVNQPELLSFKNIDPICSRILQRTEASGGPASL
jgi:hypothetical protein